MSLLAASTQSLLAVATRRLYSSSLLPLDSCLAVVRYSHVCRICMHGSTCCIQHEAPSRGIYAAAIITVPVCQICASISDKAILIVAPSTLRALLSRKSSTYRTPHQPAPLEATEPWPARYKPWTARRNAASHGAWKYQQSARRPTVKVSGPAASFLGHGEDGEALRRFLLFLSPFPLFVYCHHR